MSELATTSGPLLNQSWKLLLSVSALALFGVTPNNAANASDTFLASDPNPTLWFEFGGDFERIDGRLDQWEPVRRGVLAGSGDFIRHEPSGSFGIEGSASYQPKKSDWKLSVSIRYARAQRQQAFHTQTGVRYTGQRNVGYGATTRHLENHMVVDFSAGKDVGIGLFRSTGSVALGVRIAQFNQMGDDMVSSAPYKIFPRQRLYFQTDHFERRTSAWGPSVSWNGAIPLTEEGDSKLSVEWGALGALLFGKQKVSGHNKSHEFYHSGPRTGEIDFPSVSIERRKNVLIPNLEGSAALSFSLPAAKVTVGYRADAFWSAMDGGIAVHKSKNQIFHGPFATISLGLGG